MARTRKKPVNVSIDQSLVTQAKELQINLSQTLEKAVVMELRKIKREKWLRRNSKAVNTHNRRVEKQGVFSDRLRGF